MRRRQLATAFAAAVLVLAVLACGGDTTPTSARRSGPSPTGTARAAPSSTPKPSPSPSPTAIPTVDTSGCSLGAAFEADVTIPDGTEIETGGSFSKTWRLRNTGTCEWGPGFLLRWTEGDQMGGADVLAIPPTSADQSADVTVDLVAPMEQGSYRGTWRMCVHQDDCFGDKVTVVIVAATPPSPVPTVNPAVRAYDLQVVAIQSKKLVELRAVQTLLEAYDLNPAVYYSEEWREKLEYHVLGWYMEMLKLTDLSPPAEMRRYHDELMLAVADEDMAQNLFLKWLDIPDPRLKDQALAHVRAAAEHLETASGILEQMGY